MAHPSAGLLRSRRRGWDTALSNLGKGEQENIYKFTSIWVYSAPPRKRCLGTILAAVLVVFCTNHIYNSYYQPKS